MSTDQTTTSNDRTTAKIGVIGGDGIGPEVTAEAIKVIEAAGFSFERVDYDLGAARYLRDGTVLPDSVLDEWRGLDALKADFEVIRENTEGTYAGEGGFLRKGTVHEIATQGSVNTRHGVERCVRYAFDRAAATDRKHLTLVHKKNVLTFAGDLWQRTFDEVAAEYPAVATAYDHIDETGAINSTDLRARARRLARQFGGKLEPVHGTAPDIAGQNKANPMAAIISARLMLEFLGADEAAAKVRAACDQPERYAGSTTEIGDAVAAAVAAI